MFARKLAASAVLALAAVGTASASDFSLGLGATIGAGVAAGGYSGSTSGHGNTTTNGGSMAQTANYGTGLAVQHSSNAGGGYAGSYGQVTPTGSYSGTVGGSDATSVSGGFTIGNGSGNTGGAVGTDFAANSWNSHQTVGAGAGVIAGGFAALGGFGNF